MTNDPGRATPSRPLRRPFSRRAFLGTLASAGILAPFLPLSRGLAAGEGYPRRLVLLFSPNGTLHERWKPSGSAKNFELSQILAPLEPWKDRLVVVDGLHVITTSGPGDEHQKGMGHLWTASPLQASATGANGSVVLWSSGASVDQVIAQAIGSATAHQSLEFGVQTGDGASVFSRMSYAGPGEPVAPEKDPSEMFDRLFGDLDADPGAIEALKAQRGSVIDLVKGDLDSLATRMGTEDRAKLEAHLDAMREIEKRNELAVPVCEVPPEPGVGPGGNAQFPAVSRLQIDQLVMALACDLTRVASLQWSTAVSSTRFDWLGIGTGHHDLSHLGNSDPTMLSTITAINTWYAEEVAYLLDKLAAVPEGDGTLLDNTLVVWGNELSRGNTHGHSPVPFVLAGGAGGAFETGRWLEVDGHPHNRLLVSICRAMGLDETDTFGATDPGTGGLPGLV
jgi:hypothetical protein